jgi:FixJ family two-component response regulator
MNRTPPLIAVVDDEESVRKAIERLLRSAGIEVAIFSSGAEFLNAIATRRIDCVVLDLHMSGLSGFDVQTRLMQSRKWLPIIVMTGHDTPDSRARALAGGAGAYLLKPIDEQVLLDAIARVTEHNES